MQPILTDINSEYITTLFVTLYNITWFILVGITILYLKFSSGKCIEIVSAKHKCNDNNIISKSDNFYYVLPLAYSTATAVN